MFDPEKEVPSLELCKKLKELGFPQEGGGVCWVVVEGCKHKKTKWGLKFYEKYEDIPYWAVCYKAPTCRELGEWLPHKIDKNGKGYYLNIGLTVISYDAYDDDSIAYVADKDEPSLRAKALIWLAEKGYVDFKKEAK